MVFMCKKNGMNQEIDLSVKKLKAELEKIEAETEALRYASSPKIRKFEILKQLSSSFGIITVLLGILAFAWSIYQWQYQADRDRKVRVEERLDKVLSRLGDKEIKVRLGGIASSRSFLTPEASGQHEQVLFALTHLLAIEEEPIARDAIVKIFQSKEIVSNCCQKVKKDALHSLITLSRALVMEGKLHNTRVMFVPDEPEPKSIEARAAGIALAINALVKSNIKPTDLSGIYCVRCNFAGIDLNDVSFDRAILFGSDFSNSKLQKSSFKDTDIFDVKFISADLRWANFSLPEDILLPEDCFTGKILRRLRKERILLSGPIFDCADLRNATFSGYPLFCFYEKIFKFAFGFAAIYPSFREANLKGTIFNPLRMVAFFKTHKPPFTFGSGTTWSNSEFKIGFYLFADRILKENKIFDISADDYDLEYLPHAFAGSNWYEASFPPLLTKWLEKNRPPVDNRYPPHKCIPRAPWKKP